MSDSFLISEEWAEWLGQKKSELLAWLIENQPSSEIPLEDFAQYEVHLHELLASPQERFETTWDDKKINFFIKYFNLSESFWLFSVVVEIPSKEEIVFFPILTIPCHKIDWVYSLIKSKNSQILN